MPVIPNTLEKLLMLKFNVAPGPFIDVVNAWSFPVLIAALKLNVFEAIGNQSLSAEYTAKKLDTSIKGTTLLLEALETLGYVKKTGGLYVNTNMTRKWILKSSATSLAGFFPHIQDTLDLFKNLSESIRLGKPAQDGFDYIFAKKERSRNFHNAMLAIAGTCIEEVLRKVTLSGSEKKLLDLGGSHGLYTIKYCQNYPSLSGTILDWPQAEELARETITANKMEDRVKFQQGDYLKDDINDDYDIMLLMNIIHMHSLETNALILKKLADRLNSGGTIVIMDQTGAVQPGPIGRAVSRFQALNQLNATSGRTYHPDEIENWLNNAGYDRIEKYFMKSAPGFGLVVARSY